MVMSSIPSTTSEFALNPGGKRALNALLWAIKPLANLRGSIPLPFVTTFLVVALDEGKGVGTYARALGVHRAAMSRYLHAIGGRSRNGCSGLGLVTVEPRPNSPTNRQVFLTAKGCALAGEIFRQMDMGAWLRSSTNISSRVRRKRTRYIRIELAKPSEQTSNAG
jgi:hypothetical protein